MRKREIWRDAVPTLLRLLLAMPAVSTRIVALLRLTLASRKEVCGRVAHAVAPDPATVVVAPPKRDEALRRGVLKAVPSLAIKDDSPRRTNLTTANCRHRRNDHGTVRIPR